MELTDLDQAQNVFCQGRDCEYFSLYGTMGLIYDDASLPFSGNVPETTHTQMGMAVCP